MKKETAKTKCRTPQESARSKRKASLDKETPRKQQRVSENESHNHSKEDLSLGDGPAPRANETWSSSEHSSPERCNNILHVRTTSVESVAKRSRKRRAESYDKEPNRRRRSLDLPETNNLTIQDRRAEFEATYLQLDQLGDGGCGCVFAGFRKADHVPVAIKHIRKDNILCKYVEGGKNDLSAEVAIMLKLASITSGSVEESAPVSLLDWYDLDQELILILERPVPCKDLSHYIMANGGYLKEQESKIILRQLVNAAKDLVDKFIFHRDIKIENILIETGSRVPRVRLIDFGLACFFKKRSFFRVFYGTVDHAPPEWIFGCSYSAGPTTVWQVGVVLFELLHSKPRFKTERFIRRRLPISNELSKKCQDFLRKCLDRNPDQRPSLQQLKLHPWLK